MCSTYVWLNLYGLDKAMLSQSIALKTWSDETTKRGKYLLVHYFWNQLVFIPNDPIFLIFESLDQ